MKDMQGVSMVRELAKSALSFSWALSLLGIKQTVNLGQLGQNGGDLFGPVTQVAVGQLDESMKGIYRSGDHLQSRMIDMAFGSVNPANWANPANWTPGRPMGPVTDTPAGSATQAGQPSTAPMDVAAFWMNPLNWFNPANWNMLRFMGDCGQPGGPCSPQGPGQTSAGSTGSGSAQTWGPMPGQKP
jgi:hypothetical protein